MMGDRAVGHMTSEEIDRLLNLIINEENHIDTRRAYRDFVRTYIRELEADKATHEHEIERLQTKSREDERTIEELWALVNTLREFPKLRRAIQRAYTTPQDAYTADEADVRRLVFEFLAEDTQLADTDVYANLDDWLAIRKARNQPPNPQNKRGDQTRD
jgi:uncharacterized membrane-anchored protein YjiN (DUF445 family)